MKLKQFITPAGNLRRAFKKGDQIREHLRVGSGVDLIAVFNGDDPRLERFWGNQGRRATLAGLAEIGVRAITGPTFSVLEESGEHPASHNVVMLQRHHQIAFEAQRQGLLVIPNIYWRSSADLSRWSRWLTREREVRYISRDFSRTKHPSSFREELSGLIQVLENVDRSLHVLLVGVGAANGEIAREAFATSGTDWSLVSERPLITATNGRLLPDRRKGEKGEAKSDLSVETLIRENVERFEAAITPRAASRKSDPAQGELFEP